MELGIYSFAEMPVTDQKSLAGAKRLDELMDEIVLTDEIGLDVYAIGEHHRPDFAVSAPTIILGAAAVKTKNIKLASAVTVLSSEDPVRVFQQFSTIDLLSHGRAEIMAGRGSFIESFPLFGYDLNDYDALFSEKLELLLELNKSEKVKWQGEFRAPLNNIGVYPRPFQDHIPVWVAAGGTPASAVRAANLGLPLALAIIGGSPDQFIPFIDLYKNTWAKSSHADKPIQIGINCHVFISESSQKAADDFYAPYAEVMSRIGRERGWGPMNRGQYESMRSAHGSLFVGSPQQVIDKMMHIKEIFGNTRFLSQMSVGPIAHDLVMNSIELFGKEVAPIIRKTT
ncbi:MAG: Atu2307/SP_0267 family LLM class monooxygenase [Saprospiraceae bacterium]